MRILLSADWHLKQKHRFTRIIENRLWDRMCAAKLNTLWKIVRFANKEKYDKVVIAGDIFDTSNPPEALKAEVCKILNAFTIPVLVITGRPGDHDFVSENNYVMMDLKEAYGDNGNVTIIGNNSYKLSDTVLVAHLMLDGINEMYKKTVKLNDPIFADSEVILLGDYHAFYHKKYGGKNFIYPGTPYPTRYGENSHSIAEINLDTKGNFISCKQLNLNTYKLIEQYLIDGDYVCDVPFVLKYKMVIVSTELAKVSRQLEHIRKEKIEKDKNCMDVVWELKTTDAEDVMFSSDDSGTSLINVCEKHIMENGGEHSDKIWKLFQKFIKECA